MVISAGEARKRAEEAKDLEELLEWSLIGDMIKDSSKEGRRNCLLRREITASNTRSLRALGYIVETSTILFKQNLSVETETHIRW